MKTLPQYNGGEPVKIVKIDGKTLAAKVWNGAELQFWKQGSYTPILCDRYDDLNSLDEIHLPAIPRCDGMHWDCVPDIKKNNMKPLKNDMLKAVLNHKTYFTSDELEAMGVYSVSTDHYIKGDGCYFVPMKYGTFVDKSIGGVSKTVRLEGLIRCREDSNESNIVVFAVFCPSSEEVSLALKHVETAITIKEVTSTNEWGVVVEIVVHSSSLVDNVCARIARTGAFPILENVEHNSNRSIGIERLDRVECCVADGKHNSSCASDYTLPEYKSGPKRGMDNWKFSWVNPEWKFTPLTWDHVAGNFLNHQRFEQLPAITRQHVARMRISQGICLPFGTRWNKESVAQSIYDKCPHTRLLTDQSSHPRVRVDASILANAIQEENELSITEEDLHAWESKFGTLPRGAVVVLESNGDTFKVKDFGYELKKAACVKERIVSAALSQKQSIQLISAFYLYAVEEVDDETKQICAMIMERYLIDQGYIARWMGKYEQCALYVGNGDKFRQFKNMKQYDIDQLSMTVLNRLCDRNGKVITKGSKGSRSKKATKGKYVPKRTLTRTLRQETVMRE